MTSKYAKCGLCGRYRRAGEIQGRTSCPQCFGAWLIGYADAMTYKLVEKQFDCNQAKIVFIDGSESE